MDGLRYKEDLGEALERLRAFWAGEVEDRACIAVTAPMRRREPLPEPWSDEQFLTDPEFIVRRCNAQMSGTWFGGEDLPFASAPGNLLYAAYGGRGSFESRTVWVDPVVTNAEEWEEYRFDPGNPFYQHVLRITRALAEDGPGSYLVGSPGVFGPLDAMAQMRGMCDFVMELAVPEYESVIRRAWQECVRGFRDMSVAIYRAAGRHADGYAVFPGLWAPGRVNYWSADFSCLLGPQHARRWLLPEVEELTGVLEHSLYHLDGFDAARFLPLILETRGLGAIQFTPGAGHDSLAEALPVYRAIQAAGCVQYLSVTCDEVEAALQALDPAGLLIFTSAPDVESGMALLDNARRWSSRSHRS